MGTNPADASAPRSPLRELLEAQVARVSAAVERTGTEPLNRAALQRFLSTLQRLVDAADSLTAPAAAVPSRAQVLWVGDPRDVEGELESVLPPGIQLRRVAAPDASATWTDLLIAAGGATDSIAALRKVNPALPVLVLARPESAQSVRERLADEPALVIRAPVDARDLALCAIALLALPPPRRDAAPAELSLDAKSYVHLAGLLPRALERAVDFDVGASVIARPGEEPVVDVYARGAASRNATEKARQRALALFRLLSVGTGGEEDIAVLAESSPFRSTMHIPLATSAGIFGLTMLMSRRADAFSADDRRVLADLASHAAGSYRRVERSVRQLRLTPRQSQILSLIAAGLSDQAVADRLRVAHRTVRTHLDRLLREHGFRSRTEAVAAWLRGQGE